MTSSSCPYCDFIIDMDLESETQDTIYTEECPNCKKIFEYYVHYITEIITRQKCRKQELSVKEKS